MSDKMIFYNQLREVPEEAKTPIRGGRLKGMTDINPMWRIKRLTELFGPCGVGWWYEVTNREIVEDCQTHESAAFVDINLYYINPETGETSKPIFGTGGASFVAKESNGFYLSNECFKMALTDAISVSAKALGVAANVYFAKDRTKYTAVEDATKEEPKDPEEKPKAKKKSNMVECEQKATNAQMEPMACPICGNTVASRKDNNGDVWAPIDILKRCGGMCPECYKQNKNESKNT